MSDAIAARWRAVRARVDAACVRAGRDPSSVTVVAVSKRHPPEAVEAAVAAGVTDVGENYAQELVIKQEAVAARVRWHYIGRLQRNKAKLVVGRVDLLHAVDSAELAIELDRRAAAAGCLQPVLIAVNAAGEDTKGGVTAAGAVSLVEVVGGLSHLRCDGLMTMPPPAVDAAASRPYFRDLRVLRDRLARADRPLAVLSMGMSDDFEIAIEEGATHVRIGTAIFGARLPTAGDADGA